MRLPLHNEKHIWQGKWHLARLLSTGLVLSAMVLCGCEKDGRLLEDNKETVVLLHGMGRGRPSMWLLGRRLRKAGFVTSNFPYTTFPGHTLDDISARLHEHIREKVKTKRYHLVGHSLGNIIIRNGFKGEFRPGLGRVVMLAPPNQPPKLAAKFNKNPLYRLFGGDSGKKLASKEFYDALPAPKTEFGIIAGDKGQRITFKEPNDGVVAVANTKLEGMKAWIVLHHAHTFLMNSRDTAECCVQFLNDGSFPGGAG